MRPRLQPLLILIAAAFALLLPASYAAQDSVAADSLKPSETKSWKPQAHCPVMGGKINRKFFSDYAGQRIYYCCGGCQTEFEKEPAKYMKKLESMGETTALVPAKKNQEKQKKHEELKHAGHQHRM